MKKLIDETLDVFVHEVHVLLEKNRGENASGTYLDGVQLLRFWAKISQLRTDLHEILSEKP